MAEKAVEEGLLGQGDGQGMSEHAEVVVRLKSHRIRFARRNFVTL
jgi:hypothetical protein